MVMTTITIPLELKKELENLKGNKTWEQFLKELIEAYKEYKEIKKKEAFEKLVKLLEEDKKWESVEEFLEERKKERWFRY